MAFVFLSHQSAQENITLVVLHSLLFQLITDDKTLRPVLAHYYEHNYRKLVGSYSYVRDLIRDILTNLPAMYLVIDGLNEIAETERSTLLSSLQILQRDSPSLKLLISSKTEHDINASLRFNCHMIAIHNENSKDIANSIKTRTSSWLAGLTLAPELVHSIRGCTKEIATKSQGEYLSFQIVLTWVVD